MPDAYPIATTLTPETLSALIGGTAAAIVIPDFAMAEECLAGMTAAMKMPSTVSQIPGDAFKAAPSIGYAGGSAERLERYLAEAPAIVAVTRQAFRSGVSPIDRLLARVLEIWGPGLKIPQRNGRRYPSQNIRWWGEGGETHPHIDRNETMALPFGLKRRFGVNIYLETGNSADGAGALDLWERLDPEVYARHEAAAPTPAGYGIHRAALGRPRQAIVPARGTAVIFDASILHGVRRVAGNRVTNGSFLGVVALDQPLLVFA